MSKCWKTTLMNHVLNNRQGLRVAVIVNDMSEVNIDADLIRNGGADLSRTNETLVEMTNGCICCTLRDDLLKEVSRLAHDGRFDYLLIESTGISEPLPVAEIMDASPRSLNSIWSEHPKVTRISCTQTLIVIGPRIMLPSSERTRASPVATSAIVTSLACCSYC